MAYQGNERNHFRGRQNSGRPDGERRFSSGRQEGKQRDRFERNDRNVKHASYGQANPYGQINEKPQRRAEGVHRQRSFQTEYSSSQLDAYMDKVGLTQEARSFPQDTERTYNRNEKEGMDRSEGRTENRNFQPRTQSQPSEANLSREDLIAGRNPVREALRAQTPINKILVASGDTDDTLRRIVALAKENHVPVQEVERRRLNQLALTHQGVVAFLASRAYSSVEEILDYAKEKGEDPFIVVLDGITDPHNLGAIIRSAECVGAHGVILAQNRAALLTATVEKAAAGALQWMRVAKVTNISRTLERLQKEGIWCYAASMGGKSAWETDFHGPVALVIGDEGEGISRLVMEKCDFQVSLPMRGQLDSLNASAASCVLLYEILRARVTP